MFFHCSELYAFSGFYCGWRELAQKRIGILQAHFCAILSIVHNGGLSWLLFSGFRDLASLEKSVRGPNESISFTEFTCSTDCGSEQTWKKKDCSSSLQPATDSMKATLSVIRYFFETDPQIERS